MLSDSPDVAWFEVHSENFLGAGGQAQETLLAVRATYPVSLHGVGLGLGSAIALDHGHLAELRQLIDVVEPGLVSEHLAWGAVGDRHLNDLLPLPYTEEALALMVERVDATQQALGRRILIENISSYLTFTHSTIPEWEFLAALAETADCGILCDVNNIYVNSVNHGFDAISYIEALPAARIAEIHLAGFTEKTGLDAPLLIDSHSRPVAEPVWQLYKAAISHFGPLPTLIEWDREIPPLPVLLSEADQAQRIMDHVTHAA